MALVLFLMAVVVAAAWTIHEQWTGYARPDHPLSPPAITGTGGTYGADAPVPAPISLGAEHGTLSYLGNLAVLRLRGTPAEIGAAHGRLVASTIAAPTRTLVTTLDEASDARGLWAAMSRPIRLGWRYRLLADGIPGHQLVEIAAMADAVQHSLTHGAARGWTAALADEIAIGIPDPGTEAGDRALAAADYRDLVRAQTVLDLGRAAPWSSAAAFAWPARALSAIAPVRDASGDRLLIGRTFALPGVADGGDAAAANPVVAFVRASDVIAYAAVTWPGMVGVVSGINADGIAVLLHPTRTADIDAERVGQPIALLARDVLENAHSLDDAIAILQHAQPLGSAAFVIVDGQRRTWAVVERTPTQVVVRKNEPAVIDSTLSAEAFTDDAEQARLRDISPAMMRAQRAERLLRQTPKTAAEMAALLRDRRSSAGAPLPVGHRGALWDGAAVHAMIIDASTLTMWIADGGGTGAGGDAQGRFRSFDLRHELRGEGARPAPPADVPAATGDDAAMARRLRRARAHLRLARLLIARGQGAQADEAIARALTLAEDLPEATLLAGDRAYARGDNAAGARWYRRFIDLGADDLAAEARVRDVLGLSIPGDQSAQRLP